MLFAIVMALPEANSGEVMSLGAFFGHSCPPNDYRKADIAPRPESVTQSMPEGDPRRFARRGDD
jgi:hypothetical protein